MLEGLGENNCVDELACNGTAILLISSELPELINLSRRIIVLREGTRMGELQRAEFSQTALMRLMAGIAPMAELSPISGLKL